MVSDASSDPTAYRPHHSAHAAYTLHYHLVWSCHRRQPHLTGQVATALRAYLMEQDGGNGVHVLACHVEPEHVHVVASVAPTCSIAEVMKRFKGGSSRLLREEYPDLPRTAQRGLWGAGYFARTLGEVTVAQAKAYVDRQRTHHASDGA